MQLKRLASIFLIAAGCWPVHAQQLYRPMASRAATVSLQATVASRLSVNSMLSQASVATASDGQTQISLPVNVAWNLNPSAVSHVQFYAYAELPIVGVPPGNMSRIWPTLRLDGSQFLYTIPVNLINSDSGIMRMLNVSLRQTLNEAPSPAVLHLRAVAD